ncbi:MAG: hypothetical protein E7574_03010 [Ruminococcaceae bacterium]|nr:hypothetical protein [Oscillospiraceae bacterium]
MNDNKKVSWLYVVLTVIISAVATFFQYIVKNNYIDESVDLYKTGVVTPEAFGIFMVIAVLFMLTPAFIMRMDALPKKLKYGSFLTSFMSILCAFLVAFTAFMFFMSKSEVAHLGSTQMIVYKLRFACSVIAFPTAIYYLTVSFTWKKNNDVISWLSFLPILWTLIYLMSVYFDHSVLINSPLRIVQQTALILLMVYQLFETRSHIGNSKPIVYFILTNLTILFLSTAFIPELVDLLLGKQKMTLDMSYVLYGCGMVLYVLARTVDFAAGCNFDGKKLFTRKTPPKNDIFSVDEAE